MNRYLPEAMQIPTTWYHSTSDRLRRAMESGELEEILVNEACVNVLNMAQRGLSAKRGGKFDYEKDHNFCRRVAEESACTNFSKMRS